jgi:hypothetical protein
MEFQTSVNFSIVTQTMMSGVSKAKNAIDIMIDNTLGIKLSER